MTATIGALAIIIALLCDWKGLGTKAIGNRVAAVLALVGYSVFVTDTPLARWLVDLGLMAQHGLGDLVTGWSAPAGRELHEHGMAWLTLVVAVVWFAGLLPKKTADRLHFGDIVDSEYTSLQIWGGGLVLVLFAHTIPGPIGRFVVDALGLLARLAAEGLAHIVTGG